MTGSGAVTRTAATIRLPNGGSYVVAPVNSEMATGAVCIWGLSVIDRAMTNSFQEVSQACRGVQEGPPARLWWPWLSALGTRP